jgi:hypothetical protein
MTLEVRDAGVLFAMLVTAVGEGEGGSEEEGGRVTGHGCVVCVVV